jgi:hypothetical protein
MKLKILKTQALVPAFALAASAVLADPAAASPNRWQMAGKTYNSVAFVDMNSVSRNGALTDFTAMRVSGQPASDGWSSVFQRLQVNCDTRIFVDGGSRIEQADGTVVNYPGSAATQKAVSRGVFFDMFQLVCSGRTGLSIGDPKTWTRRNFKPGQ